MTDHTVVSREEWQAARDELMRREKEHTRMADELARQRRELPWVAASVFTWHDGVVYQSYGTTARGVEFVMGYYPILDRVPNGRDEGDGFQTWIRRRDEYA